MRYSIIFNNLNISINIFLLNFQIPVLQEKLIQREKQLNELIQEFMANKQVLTENLKEAVNETKKQYAAIDNALEVCFNNNNCNHLYLH